MSGIGAVGGGAGAVQPMMMSSIGSNSQISGSEQTMGDNKITNSSSSDLVKDLLLAVAMNSDDDKKSEKSTIDMAMMLYAASQNLNSMISSGQLSGGPAVDAAASSAVGAATGAIGGGGITA